MFTQAQIWTAIDRLARDKGWSSSHLALRAGLDATALNRSKRFGPGGKPRWPSTETMSKILAAAGVRLRDLAQLIEGDILRAGHILLVDDDEHFRAATAAGLRGAGYQVHVALDHHDALAHIDGEGPLDLLCTEIVMPNGLGGPALARYARRERPAMKILYLTGYDVPGGETDPQPRILRKPIAPEGLLEVVGELLGTTKKPGT